MNPGGTSTADEVLAGRDLTGTRVLVTGVSSGVGAETARVLAAHGATVIGTARDLAKGAADARSDDIELVQLDLASLSSVRASTDGLLAAARPLDVIICNAGVMAVPFKLIAAQPNAAAAFTWKTVAQGAATSVWAGFAAPADAVGARYCEDCRVAEVNDDPAATVGVRSYALDPNRAEALWLKSTELVNARGMEPG